MDEETAIQVLWKGVNARGSVGGQTEGQGDASNLSLKKTEAVSCDGDFTLMCTVHLYERHSMDNVNTVPTLDEMVSASNTYKRF